MAHGLKHWLKTDAPPPPPAALPGHSAVRMFWILIAAAGFCGAVAFFDGNTTTIDGYRIPLAFISGALSVAGLCCAIYAYIVS